jgi:hypothetical protein
MKKKNKALSPEKQIAKLKRIVAQKELVIFRLIEKREKISSDYSKKRDCQIKISGNCKKTCISRQRKRENKMGVV